MHNGYRKRAICKISMTMSRLLHMKSVITLECITTSAQQHLQTNIPLLESSVPALEATWITVRILIDGLLVA